MSLVVIKRCATYTHAELKAALHAGMQPLGGWDAFFRPGKKVLLKVNLIGPKPPESAAVTHAELVRVLVRLARERGCEVWIGDSAGGSIAGLAPTARAMRVAGYEKVAVEEGARIKNFDREGVREVVLPGNPPETLYLAKPLFDADVVVNLPKFKTHSAGVFTGAVKNFYGCIPGQRKAEYHRRFPDASDLGQVLVLVHRARPADLHIMDGVVGMDGMGPTAGKPYPAGILMFSTDPLAMDTVASAMIGLCVKQVPILVAACRENLGVHDLAAIRIEGDFSAPPRLPRFRIPPTMPKTRGMQVMFRGLISFLKTRPRINPKVCTKCNLCVESCPVKAIDRETHRIDYSKCIECMCCHELCEFKAVELKHDHPVAGLLMGRMARAYRR